MSPTGRAADTETVDERQQLRQHVAQLLDTRADAITNDVVATYTYRPAEELTARLTELVLRILIATIREGEADSRSTLVTDLRQLAREKELPIRHLFDLVYLVERTALDELALDESFGATSEPWGSIAQLARRSSFELLAAFAERLGQEAGDEALIDPLTTLHSRAVLLAALDKELQRSERFGHPFALIVCDVDRLSDINAEHGFGFGDRVLERVGIVIRNYFRGQDWVSRCAGDRFAVLLPETQQEHAERLADRMREAVKERMSLRDYRSERQVPVTVSVAVLFVEAVDATVRAEDLVKEAEQAVHRAKHAGRNRVERVEINVKAQTPPSRDSEVL